MDILLSIWEDMAVADKSEAAASIIQSMREVCKAGAFFFRRLNHFQGHVRVRRDTQLMDACQDADVDVIQVLIAKSNVNAFHAKTRKTALMYACQYRQPLTVVQALLSKGADVNFLDETGEGAMWYACMSGSDDIIQELVAAKARVTTSVLESACIYCENKHTIQLLLDYKRREVDMGNSLMHFCANEHLHCPLLLRRILDAVQPENSDVDHALIIVCEQRRKQDKIMHDMIQVLIEYGANLMKALSVLCSTYSSNAAILRLLLGQDVDIDSKSLLEQACKIGNVEAIDVLLEQRVWTIHDVSDALIAACRSRSLNPTILDAFLAHGVDVSNVPGLRKEVEWLFRYTKYAFHRECLVIIGA